jgi:hypothetical protein
MKTALSGPLIVYGSRNPQGEASTGTSNAQLAPSLFWGGAGLYDPRGQYDRVRYGALGFMGSTGIPVIDAVPSTLAVANISASASPGAGAIALVSATGAGVTVLATALTVWPSGNVLAAGALALDGAPGLVTFGRPQLSSGNTVVSLYDPSKALARNIRITSGGNDSGITFTVNGNDIYGYPMTEAITGANIGVASGKKAFKFVNSITHTGSVASTMSVGTGDVYGFPLRVDTINYAEMSWNASIITANTGFTLADTTSPATTTTGDVRGTYAVQSASDGTKRLQVFVTPTVANIGTLTGLFGVTQT